MQSTRRIDLSFGVRLILALVASLVVTVVTSHFMIPVLRRHKLGQHVRDDGPRSHLSKEGTPTMGGLMMLWGMMVSLAFALYSDDHSVNAAIFLIVGTLLFALIGFLDDILKLVKRRSLGLRAWQKIVLQIGAAAVVSCFAYYAMGEHIVQIPFSHYLFDLGEWYIPFSMFVFLAMVNSVNLTDGLDGLAGSLSLTNGASFLAVIVLLYPALLLVTVDSLSGADGVVANTAVFCCTLIGSCIGFLCYNRHPARVFMGDTGSFALGAALTAISATLGQQLLLPIMGFMYVLSSVSVIIQVTSFKLRHKRVFRMAPLHHHFELKGIPETKVVVGYVVITVVLSVIAVLSATFI